MAKKLPYIELYVNDFLADVLGLKLATVGFWMKVLCHLHRKTAARGTDNAPADFWCRLVGCDETDLWAAVGDLQANDYPGEGQEPRVTWTGKDSVTFTSRRILRDEKKREGARTRMQRFRCAQKNADATIGQRPHTQPPNPPTPQPLKDSEAQPPSTGAPGAGGCPREAETEGSETDRGTKSRALTQADVPLYPVFKTASADAKVPLGDVARVLVGGQAPAVALGWLLMVEADVSAGTCKSAPALFRTVSDRPAPPDRFYEEAKSKLRAYGVREVLPPDVQAELKAWLDKHTVGKGK